MPLINVPIDDPREPGRTLNAWVWCEEFTVNHAREEVRIIARGWNSSDAAYDPNSESWTRSLYFQGEQYRTLIQTNPMLFIGMATAVDGLIHGVLGGEIVNAVIPEWTGE